MDCMERIDHHRVNKKALESLVKCGAFDWTGQPLPNLDSPRPGCTIPTS